MMVTPIIFLSLLTLLSAESPLYKCFYNRIPLLILEKISVINPSPLPVQSGGYSYQIVWDTVQQNIESSAYVFMGYRIQYGDTVLSFTAALNTITSVGVRFVFIPQPGSAIIQAHFSIVLKKTCSGYMELHYVEFVPLELSQLVRSSQFSYTSINLSRPIGNVLTNYQTSAFFSSFILSSFTGQLELQIFVLPFTAGNTTIDFKIYSGNSHSNVYPKICFTFIIIDVSTFFYQVSTYVATLQRRTLVYPSITIPLNFGIPASFHPQLNEKCLIAFTWVLNFRNRTLTEMIIVDTGNSSYPQMNSVDILNNRFMVYSMMCIQDCVNGYVVTGSSMSTCVTCALGIDLCERCFPAPNPTCAGCTSGNYLMLVINKCYTSCLPGYFSNSSFVCLACLDKCLTCSNQTTCITCKFGEMVTGGCTTVDGCNVVLYWEAPNYCLQCRQEDNFVLTGSKCLCKTGYFLITDLCINIIGCLAAKKINNVPVCVSCNAMHGLFLNGTKCDCLKGYELIVDFCYEKCGDGTVFKHQCDDGNNNDGDGCSSTCTIEDYYLCSNGSANSSSLCKYYGPKISLSVKHINKAQLINKGIFTFNLRPSLFIFDKLDLSKMVQFECNQSISINEVSYSKGQLTVTVEYLQNLQGNSAKISLMLDSNNFESSSTILSFKMISQGPMLILSDYKKLQLFKTIILFLSLIVLIIFVATSLAHKMIGIEMLNTFQIIYLVHLSANNYTEPFGLLKYLSITCWKLYPQQAVGHISTVWANFPFSQEAQQFTFLFIGSILTIFLFFFFLSVFKNVASSLFEDLPSKPSSVSVYFYNHIFFPFAIAFFGIFWAMLIGEEINQAMSSHLTRCFLTLVMITTGLVYFAQWKYLTVSQQQNHPFFGLQRCKRNYIPTYLSIVFLLIAMIIFNYSTKQASITKGLLGIQVMFLFWKIIIRPYEYKLHNIGIIHNSLTSITFLSWVVLREYFPVLRSQDNQFNVIIGLSAFLLLSLIISAVRAIYEILLYRKRILLERERKINLKKAKRAKRLNRELNIQKDDYVSDQSKTRNVWKPSIATDFKQQTQLLLPSGKEHFEGLSMRKRMKYFLLSNMLVSNEIQ